LCLDTEAETWFRNIKCGRQAMKALQVHYDGPDEGRRRKEEARAKLKTVYYKHEATFTFEKFVTSLYDGFQVLEKYGEPLYDEEKLMLEITENVRRQLTKQHVCLTKQHVCLLTKEHVLQ